MGDCFDLFTQTADVDVHGPWSHEAVAAPDLIKKPIAVEYMTRVGSQIIQELELQRTQLHRPVTHGHLLSSHVEPQAPGLHHLPLFCSALLPAQNRSDARHKLPRAEGFDHIVVPANLQTEDSVHFLTLGREENYRQSFQAIVDAEALANLKTVFVRQKDIEQKYVRGISPQIIKPLASSPETFDLEPFLAKVVTD
jgi:hypothetical protein